MLLKNLIFPLVLLLMLSACGSDSKNSEENNNQDIDTSVNSIEENNTQAIDTNVSAIEENDTQDIDTSVSSIEVNATLILRPIASFSTSENALDLLISPDGTIAYLATSSKGLLIFDITDSMNIIKLAEYPLDNANDLSFCENNTHILVSGLKDLTEVDVSNPRNPSFVAQYQSFEQRYIQGSVVSADNKYLFLAANDGVTILNIEDKNNPEHVAFFVTNGGGSYAATDLRLSSNGDILYVSDKYDGFYVMDISDISNPITLSVVDPNAYLYSISLSKDENYSYLASSSSGLDIVDISDSSSPFIATHFNIPSSGTLLSAIESKDQKSLYLATTKGVTVVDKSDGVDNLHFITNYETNTTTHDIEFSNDGNLAYIANSKNGLVILDLTQQQHIEEINFGTFMLKFRLDNDEGKDLKVRVYSNDTSIISTNNYENSFSLNEYNNTMISLPVDSLYDAIGDTYITIEIDSGNNITTQKVYVSVRIPNK